MTQHDGSAFIHHVPCGACGSKDNNSLYTDGHTYCFGCGAYSKGDQPPTQRRVVSGNLIQGVESKALTARKITEETCKRFGYGIAEYDGVRVQVAPYYDTEGRLVAQKIRFANKDFKFLGDSKAAAPFGYNTGRSGRMLTITEGEIDALSMSQVTGNKWPVWSIGCGAGPQVKKYLAERRHLFDGFESVVIMFDNDERGREASQIAAEILGSKAKVATLPLKDANDMLVAGQTEKLIQCMWDAQPYRPEGIVDLSTLKDTIKERPREGLSWPFERLTKLTFGIRTGELYALGAGTGVGKTDFFTQLMAHMVSVHREKIGVFSLEQKVSDTGLRIVGKFTKRPLHIPDRWDDAIFDSAWGELVRAGNVFLYDSFGRNEWDSVKAKMEFLHHSEGVRYFFLDHLTAFVAGEEDERGVLDGIMEEMSSFANQYDVAVFFISHLNTPQGTPHEEGGRVTIKNFRGSRSIGFWSHYMFGMERDQQAGTELERQTTTFRVLKDRYTGRATGETFPLTYDHETGMLLEGQPPGGFGFKDESNQESPERGSSDF